MRRRAGWRLSSSAQPLEIREPDLDERPHRLLEAGLPRDGERLLVALPRLLGRHPLLEPVVAGDEQLLDPRPRVVRMLLRPLHIRIVKRQDPPGSRRVRASRQKPVRVLVADDHRLFAEALQAILDADDRLEVVGVAKDGAEAVALAERLRPDVVLLDISMPVLDGFGAAEQIAALADPPAILMLTGSSATQDVDRARRLGASGYVTKDTIAATLVESILRAVRR